MQSFDLIYSPRAQRDLFKLDRNIARQIEEDLHRLQTGTWPAHQLKPIQGMLFLEWKSGDYRAILVREGQRLAVLRVFHRRDLRRGLKRIDLRYFVFPEG